jgi:hypothetical protein
MILTHYYHPNDEPFQTLSSFSEADALNIIASLQQRTGAVYRRFENPLKYLSQRRKTETWLRTEFIKKGGQPLSAYPQYFVVDRAPWIEDGYNGESRMIQIPIANFNPDLVSFTYPDSMISYWLKSQIDSAEPTIRERVFHNAEYHGRVFGLKEISKIIEQFGIPNTEWQTEPNRKYDLFIEAQVWDIIKYPQP